MGIDPEVLASALITLAAGIGAIASFLNKRARLSRRELRRTREALELGARYIHDLRLQLSDAGITPKRPPARWRRLIQSNEQEDDEDQDDE